MQPRSTVLEKREANIVAIQDFRSKPGITVVSVFILALVSAQAKAQVGGSVSYQPPLIPIVFSLNERGEITVEGTGSISTPFGTFSGTIRPSYVDPKNTYFLVRKGATENIYCIGRTGKLRLKTEGSHDIDLSNLLGYANVIVVEIKSMKGKISLDFIPDENQSDLARIRGSFTDLVLDKKGSVIVDGISDTLISKNKINRVVFADLPTIKKLLVAVDYMENGRRISENWICKDQMRIEALWFRECLKRLNISKVKDLQTTEVVAGEQVVFEDGSVFLNHLEDDRGQVGYSIELRSPEFILGDFIKDIQVIKRISATSKYCIKVNYKHPNSERVNFYPLAWKDKLEDMQRIANTSNKLRTSE